MTLRDCRISRLIRRAVLATLALLVLPIAARADVFYTVTGDLSALAPGQAGFLDFQFNPGNLSGYDAATATITSFTSMDLALGSSFLFGNATGTLPGDLALDNGTSFNEVLQAFEVSGTNAGFQFVLRLSGPAINSPDPGATAGTSFGLGVLDDQFNPLYAGADPVLRIDINPGDPNPVLTTVVTPPITIGSRTIPEPSGLALMFIGATTVGFTASRMRRKPRAA